MPSPFQALRRALPLLALLLAGCAGDGLGTPREAVSFWAMGAEAEVAESMVAGFREAHPDIEVRVQRVPWSAAHEKLLTAYVGRSMPDVFQLGNTWIPEFAVLGALEPLDARVEASSRVDREDFFEGALVPNVVDGALVALPWYVDTRLLFYRRDLLTAAGVSRAPRTWEEWAAAMRRVRANGDASGFGVFLPVDEWETPVILAMQQGASLLRDGDRYGNFRSPEVRRAVDFYLSLFAEGLAPKKAEAQIASLYREFAAGYFAFFVTGPWNLVELGRRMPPELAEAWTTAPMPSPRGEATSTPRAGADPSVADPSAADVEAAESPAPGVSLAGGASLAVSSSSTRKDAAFQLVEYFTSAPVQAEFRRRSGDLPSRRSAWESADLAGDERARAFRVQLEHLAPTPRIPEWERIAAKLSLHLERMIRGEVDTATGLAELDADVDEVLAKRRWMLDRQGSPR